MHLFQSIKSRLSFGQCLVIYSSNSDGSCFVATNMGSFLLHLGNPFKLSFYM